MKCWFITIIRSARKCVQIILIWFLEQNLSNYSWPVTTQKAQIHLPKNSFDFIIQNIIHHVKTKFIHKMKLQRQVSWVITSIENLINKLYSAIQSYLKAICPAWELLPDSLSLRGSNNLWCPTHLFLIFQIHVSWNPTHKSLISMFRFQECSW